MITGSRVVLERRLDRQWSMAAAATVAPDDMLSGAGLHHPSWASADHL